MNNNSSPIMDSQMVRFFEEHIPEFLRYFGVHLNERQQLAALDFSIKLVKDTNGLERGVVMTGLILLANAIYGQWRDERIAARAAEEPKVKYIN